LFSQQLKRECALPIRSVMVLVCLV